MKPKKVKYAVFGQIVMAMFENVGSADEAGIYVSNSIYAGSPHGLTKKEAVKFMPLSIDFADYYANALSVLWGGKTKAHDSEDPLKAFRSYIPDWCNYVIVWRPLED